MWPDGGEAEVFNGNRRPANPAVTCFRQVRNIDWGIVVFRQQALNTGRSINRPFRRLMFAPKGSGSFDHFIDGRKQSLRNCEAECRSRLEIDGKFISVRRLDRQISRFLALQNAINVCS
jgi:hypothetical protein